MFELINSHEDCASIATVIGDRLDLSPDVAMQEAIILKRELQDYINTMMMDYPHLQAESRDVIVGLIMEFGCMQEAYLINKYKCY